MLGGRFFLAILFLVLSFYGFGQVTNTNVEPGFLDKFYEQEQERLPGGNVIIDIINIVITLAIIVGVVYLVVVILRRLTRAPLDDLGVIEVMATKGITAGVSIQIIRIGKDYFAISVSDKEVKVIQKIEDKELINILNVEKSKISKEVKNDFIDTILSLFRKEKSNVDVSDISERKLNFMKSQKDRIRKWGE